MIEQLSLGDITKFDEITDMNLIFCFNLLSYWKEKEDHEKRQQDKLNNKRTI